MNQLELLRSWNAREQAPTKLGSKARAGALPSPLYWMALGAFVIGVQGFMLRALLPDLAADLSVSIVAAGTQKEVSWR
jgi:hypothetical protein